MKEQLKKADLFGLAIIAATLIVYSSRNVWSVPMTVAAIVGGLLVIVSIAVKLPEIRAGLGRRSSKYGINSATSVVLVLGILGFVNYLGARHFKRVDMTSEKIYSLSDQSVQVASQVKQDLQIKAFYSGGEYQPTKDLLRLYTNQNKKISYEFIDPDKQPQLAQQDQVTVYGTLENPITGETSRSATLILTMGTKKQRIEKQSAELKEEDVTNAFVKLLKDTQKTIYFTTGHGERDLASQEPTGYQTVKSALEEDNYVVKPLNLVQESKVPADASAIVIAGPTVEPLAAEVETLDGYLKDGGSVLAMLDPQPAAAMKDFLKKWSIEPGDNIILDNNLQSRLSGAAPTVPLITSYESHPITQRFNLVTFFPLARSISPAKPTAEDIDVQILFRTLESAWGETSINLKESKQTVKYDEGKDLKGPVPLAVTATTKSGDKKPRLVVVGDADFAANHAFRQAGNGNLFTNIISYLAKDESFISIKAKDPANRPVTMTEAQAKSVAWLVQVLLPGAVLIAGISVWVKRRK